MRLLLLFTVLFLCGLAGLSLLPTPAKPVGPTAATEPATPRDGTDRVDAGQMVRVVYPPSNPADAPAARLPAPLPQAPVAQQPPATVAVATVPSDPGPQPPTAATAVANADAAPPAGAKTDINTASTADLDQLPGGGKIGRAIASHRPYGSIDDLVRKRVLRSSVFEQIKDHIAVQ